MCQQSAAINRRRHARMDPRYKGKRNIKTKVWSAYAMCGGKTPKTMRIKKA